MVVYGIYGSPRKGGNTDLLLARFLDGAEAAGAEVTSDFARRLKISGCLECGGCDQTGQCVVDDGMTPVYERLARADVVVFAAPIFFYNVPAQLKALIDRSQALWSRRMLTKKTPEERRHYDSGDGYMIGVGATRGKQLFEGAELTAKYFYDALDMTYRGGLFFRGVEKKGAITGIDDALRQAYDLGRRLAGDENQGAL